MSSQDGTIDLSFGPDSVKPDEFKPLDEAIYPMFCSNVEITTTAAGEQMIVLEWTVTGEARAGAKIRNDNLVIPGGKRKAEDPDKWNTMMNMLRNRLEVITGRSWDDDNMKLNPYTDIGGKSIKAIVVQEPYDYHKNGEHKVGVGNKIQKYLRPDDTTTKYTPQPQQQTTQQPAGSQSSPAESPQTEPAGGFSI